MNRSLVHLFVCLLATFAAAASAQSTTPLRAVEPARAEVRAAVEAHRAQRRAEARKELEITGRRLTAEERLELREQLRQQWASQSEVSHTAQSPAPDSLTRGVAQGQRVRRN